MLMEAAPGTWVMGARVIAVTLATPNPCSGEGGACLHMDTGDRFRVPGSPGEVAERINRDGRESKGNGR